MRSFDGSTITHQERCLLGLLLRGHTVATAAGAMYISTRAAETLLAQLRERTGTGSLYALGAVAERLGWHDVPL